jgi:hypothetical protein
MTGRVQASTGRVQASREHGAEQELSQDLQVTGREPPHHQSPLGILKGGIRAQELLPNALPVIGHEYYSRRTLG